MAKKRKNFTHTWKEKNNLTHMEKKFKKWSILVLKKWSRPIIERNIRAHVFLTIFKQIKA